MTKLFEKLDEATEGARARASAKVAEHEESQRRREARDAFAKALIDAVEAKGAMLVCAGDGPTVWKHRDVFGDTIPDGFALVRSVPSTPGYTESVSVPVPDVLALAAELGVKIPEAVRPVPAAPSAEPARVPALTAKVNRLSAEVPEGSVFKATH
jgi:hypothetical protein